jgi:Uma2 family endonuclease
MTAVVSTGPFLPRATGPLTVDDWYELPESDDRYELYQGMLVMAPPPGGPHQRIGTYLVSALHVYARAIGGMALMPPTGVALSDDTGFEPDMSFLLPEHRDRYTPRGIVGAPDVVVEVLSPSTRRYDLETKLPLYLAHGVAEVWIVDPIIRTIAIHRPGDAAADTVAFGMKIPSRVVDIGTGDLEDLQDPKAL